MACRLAFRVPPAHAVCGVWADDDDDDENDEHDDDDYEHHKGKHGKHGCHDDDDRRVNKKIAISAGVAASVALIAIVAVCWRRRRQQAEVPLAAITQAPPVHGQDRPFELDQLENGGKVQAWGDVVKYAPGAPPAGAPGALDYLANYESKPGTPVH